ncbi:rubredoxin [Selenihalanaerobacter shriftii]|uniref:Rubredoxin n=1 Tax=Selenihalanaerobacter shriftii TaxID=142842 RepID=A0A1T4LEH5_9FIRM|nr:rubredoxin [Selenihalanaerobacter shriftii]SJZ53202.1 Rubredoxin [Selenihalanaerobacter shriftii]
MKKYRCKECGYVYNPTKGDPAAGIDPGISFSDISYAWVCPECGADKEMFKPVIS